MLHWHSNIGNKHYFVSSTSSLYIWPYYLLIFTSGMPNKIFIGFSLCKHLVLMSCFTLFVKRSPGFFVKRGIHSFILVNVHDWFLKLIFFYFVVWQTNWPHQDYRTAYKNATFGYSSPSSPRKITLIFNNFTFLFLGKTSTYITNILNK